MRFASQEDRSATVPFEVWLEGDENPFFAYDPLLKIALAGAAGLFDTATVALTVDANRVIYRAEVSK